MKKALVVLGLLLGGVTNASGGGVGGGKVIQIIIQQTASGGVLIFRTEGRTGAPACAAATGRFAVPLSAVWGRAIYATLQTQFARGDTVFVGGLGTCNTWGDSEDVDGVSVGQIN